MTDRGGQGASLYQRILLPGLVFKGVVIGGGYATGRELIEFFFASGPGGALLGVLLAMAVWSLVCAVSFVFAHRFSAYDYRTFFQELLGPLWWLFELAYVALIILVIAVLAAAAGATGTALFAISEWIGTAALMAIIVGVCTFGSEGVARMFKYSSLFLYLVYALFLLFALTSFGDRIAARLEAPEIAGNWVFGGISYASYNVIAVVAALPFLERQLSRRDALVSGLLAGPMAMLPGLLFVVSMLAFYPAINDEALPSNYLLAQMDRPWFTLAFNLMIFVALLETGIGGINAITERVAAAYESRRASELPRWAYFAITLAIVLGSGIAAARVGLIDLIASGYGSFAYVMLAVFIVPLLTIGIYRLASRPKPTEA